MKNILLSVALLLMVFSLNAQNVTITPSGITPALAGTYPRLSYNAILALPSPVIGDQAYDTTFKCMRVYTGTQWICTYQNPADPTPNITVFAQAGGPIADFGQGIAVDGAGNVYIVGSFRFTATFGGTTINANGGVDIYVAKYNSNGALQWVQSAGGSLGAERGNGIAVDGSGNVYITGFYQGDGIFGSTTKTSLGNEDVFVAKYNSNGVIQWVQSAGGTGSDIGNGIALDASGNVYVTGGYVGTATFGVGAAFSKTAVGNTDIFVAKYNTNGVIQWVRSAGGIGTVGLFGAIANGGNAIAVNANTGNVYVTGFYSGTAVFGVGFTKTAAGKSDIFLASYDTNGTIQWVDSYGGVTDDAGTGIALDGSGYLSITGFFAGTVNFSNIFLGNTSVSSASVSSDVFVAKYDVSGSFQWVRSGGGLDFDQARGIAVDGQGNVYITGIFIGTASFSGKSVTATFSNTPTTFTDIFTAKYDKDGANQWVKSNGGIDNDSGQGLAINGASGLYMVGQFGLTATFGSSTITAAGPGTSLGLFDVFVARFDN